MPRIFGYVVGAIWILFSIMAFRASSAGASAGQPDAAFWWFVIMGFLAIAAVVALVGTARHKYQGPKKHYP